MKPGLYPEWDYGRGIYEARVKRAEQLLKEREGVTQLNGFVCTIEVPAYTAARAVYAALNLFTPANVRQPRKPSLSTSCGYRG